MISFDKSIKIYGNISIKDKDRFRKDFLKRLYSHKESFSSEELLIFNENEIDKTDSQKYVLSLVQSELNHIRKELDLDPYIIPENIYHILKSDYYERRGDRISSAKTLVLSRYIYFNNDDVKESDLLFASTVFHESLHLAAYTSLYVSHLPNGEFNVNVYQNGISSLVSPKYRTNHRLQHYFSGLHEAVVAHQEELSFLAFKEMLPASKPYIAEYISQNISYSSQRKVLRYICDIFTQKFNSSFDDQNAVFDVFLRAHFTGDLRELAALVRSCFGKKAFSRIGSMQTSKKSAEKTLRFLKRNLRN